MSGAPKMTIRQIASAAGCDTETVRKAAVRLFPALVHKGRKTEFTEAEAFRIAAVLPKKNFIGEPTQKRVGDLPKNGKVVSDLMENPKLQLSGAALDRLMRIYTDPQYKPVADRLDFILGYRHTPTYQQAELALPAPKTERPSILRQSYPITSAHAVAIVLGKEPAWVDAKSRQYDIKLDSFYLEDLYVLWCLANGHTIRSLHGPADRREAVIREHVGQIERVPA